MLSFIRAQILNAVPGSVSQTWHSDNRSRGLTIIIPLVDFTVDNGPTQVLVATCVAEEGLDIGEVRASARALCGVGSLPAVATPHSDPRPHAQVDLIICFDPVSSPTRLVQVQP